jgi:hypothetical protein
MDEPHTRDELRRSYVDAWRKQVAGSPLTPLEAMIAEVIALHPAYQPMLQNVDRALQVAPDPLQAAENPFLHMGLHMAVREQVAVDRPPGVRDLLGRLQTRVGSAHDAEHALMEALAETLWEAQRDGRTPDVARYLERARARAG